MKELTINIKDYITIETIIQEFNKINDKGETYKLNIVLYKFVEAESLAVIVSLYKYKITEEYNLEINIKGNNTYAERLDFHKNMGQTIEESFCRYSSEGRFIEITNFNQNNSIDLVNDIMKIFRENVGLEETVLRMLNYCFFEVVDNVQNHAESKIGGYLVAQRYPSMRKLRITIIDCGKGIYKSLTQDEESEYKHLTEDEAIEYCIRESVTNGKGMGNGLYHTSRFVDLNKGKLVIYSGNKKLIVGDNERNIINIPNLNGTIVSIELEMDNEVRLEDIFNGNIPVTVDEADECIDGLW